MDGDFEYRGVGLRVSRQVIFKLELANLLHHFSSKVKTTLVAKTSCSTHAYGDKNISKLSQFQFLLRKQLIMPPHLLRRSVSFDEEVTVRELLHLKEYSEEEIEATWYTDIDLSFIREECVVTIEKMTGRKLLVEDGMLCSRGLEYMTPKGSHLRHENRCISIDCVLDEQDLLWRRGTVDPERLARFYNVCVDQSSRVAHLMALRDEDFVHELVETSCGESSSCAKEKSTKQAKCFATKLHNASRLRQSSRKNLLVRPSLVGTAA
jgi:hypothetical protein